MACCCRETIPSGALTLDWALGGGYPRGRIIEACFCLIFVSWLNNLMNLVAHLFAISLLLRNSKHLCVCALQVYGPESSGKTTLALHAIAEVQRQGGVAALIDAEHAFDPDYSRVCSHTSCCATPLAFHGLACPSLFLQRWRVAFFHRPLGFASDDLYLLE